MESPELVDDYEYIHKNGIVHRSAQVELRNRNNKIFVWARRDGRMEIPSGHVDWINSDHQEESYPEAARRELREELLINQVLTKQQLSRFHKTKLDLIDRFLHCSEHMGAINNEWVNVYRLEWLACWPDLVQAIKDLAACHNDIEFEGVPASASWLSIEEIESRVKEGVRVNSSIHWLLKRNGVGV